ncbi:hypothetical protein BU52_18970 [Streptomyces toyocaensis]|uniref:Acetyltransferase n=1 Tax=Streptomyces toyocaensis TaxID=55952 RepID=A0A081XPY3_STRTO|nr:hypothetical protein [Streptomyces toyocaensis]KES05606.1 hypothetical protein BU52_18970 [Streptomyces toyocaensis]
MTFMTTVSVRPAGPSELSYVHHLLVAWYGAGTAPSPEALEHFLRHGLVGVAEVAGAVVGCAAAESPSPGHMRLCAVAVA